MESTTKEAIMEDTTSENNENDQNHNITDDEANSNSQHEDCKPPNLKSTELDYMKFVGTSDNKEWCPIIIKKECIDDNSLISNKCSDDSSEHNMDIDTTSDDLRQFDVLDDLDRHPEQNSSDDDSDTNESMDSDVPDEEIEAMLEEGIF